MRSVEPLLFASLIAWGATLSVSPLHAQEEPEWDDVALPAGHSATGGAAAGNPHGGSGPQMFQAPPDTSEEDARIPAGTIAISILDGDNAPLPHVPVTLGILHNSIAKGDSREHKLSETDANGEVSFSGLEHVSGVAYRVSVARDGGTFWASPFRLSDKGERVVLHVYPVTKDIEKALIVSQVAVFAEMKDDRVQLEEAITVYNMGRVAWVPENVIIGLPPEFSALNGQETMTGEGVTAIDKKGAQLHGTFGPGQHAIDFRWQLPYAGEKDVSFDETLPPHVAIMRVMAAASQEMRLVASGFPEAEPRTDAQGERILLTEKQMRRNDPPLARVHVELRDLPTPGPGRWIATVLAGLSVLGGLVYAFMSRDPKRAAGDARLERARLLGELEQLELARLAGDVGPKTYERAHRSLIDAIARTLSFAQTAEQSTTAGR